MNYHRRDTIAAIATPPGEGGVAIVRISGTEAEEIADRIFSGGVKSFDSHHLHYGRIAGVDSGYLAVMRGGRSYTGELVVEIHGHGGGLVARRVLEAVLEAGARAAQPGEFTFRAFMNGKVDLAQAEAVQELIAAKSERALDAASLQLQGRLSRKIEGFQKQLTVLAAILEAWVDFPEEGLDFTNEVDLPKIIAEMEALAETFAEGRMLAEGVSICLAGAPNVGKSSLMNALLERDRAIVTHLPGTTRDTLEESLRLDGFHLRLIDTAGLRETSELIEQEGIRRSEEAIRDADLVIQVLDASDPGEILESADLIVWNKCDLAEPPGPGIRVSAKEKQGLGALRGAIAELLWSESTDQVLITNLRHKEALVEAIASAKKVLSGASPEFLCIDLRAALTALGRIIGTDITEEILGNIFQRFCIGK